MDGAPPPEIPKKYMWRCKLITIEERFWSKINVSKNNECWNWIGGIDFRGYGGFKYKGKKVKPPRVAWILTHKDILLDNICVFHSCENCLCCNPAHLFLGARNDIKSHKRRNHKCIKCGETDPNKFYGNKKSYCSKCHNEYTVNLGKEKRKYIIDTLGGKCVNCGFNKWQASFDVHHIDSKKKDINWGQVRGWSKKRIDKELKGCVLFCSNCHRAIHSKELIL